MRLAVPAQGVRPAAHTWENTKLALSGFKVPWGLGVGSRSGSPLLVVESLTRDHVEADSRLLKTGPGVAQPLCAALLSCTHEPSAHSLLLPLWPWPLVLPAHSWPPREEQWPEPWSPREAGGRCGLPWRPPLHRKAPGPSVVPPDSGPSSEALLPAKDPRG